MRGPATTYTEPRLPPSHGGNRGSNPLGDANIFSELAAKSMAENIPELQRGSASRDFRAPPADAATVPWTAPVARARASEWRWDQCGLARRLAGDLPLHRGFDGLSAAWPPSPAKADIAELGARGVAPEVAAALLSQPCRGPATSRAVNGTRHSNAATIQKAACSPTAFETKPMAAGPTRMPA